MPNTITEAITTPDQDSILCEIDIAAPPARVFRALTDPAELATWFGNPSCPVKTWRMDARQGGRYGYQTAKGSVVVNGVSAFECHGEILEFDPPRLLAYSWIANWHDDKQYRTIVRWELTPAGQGTHLKVTHSGLAQEPVARGDYREGWPGALESLKTFVESH